MTKSQLDNLIGFCFNFHIVMDSDIMEHDASYILEKWEKYIGVKPKSKNIEVEVTSVKKGVYNFKSVDSNNDMDLLVNHAMWRDKWDKSGKNYDKVREILQFIFILNTRPLNAPSYSDLKNKCWTIGELIDVFEKWIGSGEQINTEHYDHLHDVVKKEINKWLSGTANNREYKLSSLI